MEDGIVLEKRENLSRCLEHIEAKTPVAAEALKVELDRQGIIFVNLERAVRMCVDVGMYVISQRHVLLSDSIVGTFLTLTRLLVIDNHTAVVMGKTIGFRNTDIYRCRVIN